jgi:hypothetical protein
MKGIHPELSMLWELRRVLSQFRLGHLAVGADGRNRALLSAFRAITSRSQPSTSKFIFGMSSWMRRLIRPQPGRALAYIDYCQQEFGVAAALSRDDVMMAAYATGDPYLEFAKQAGAIPSTATKATHRIERDRFKQAVLAVQYAMGPDSLARRIGQPSAYAVELLDLHRRTYPNYWRWSDAAVDHALLLNEIQTVFGWRVRVTAERTNMKPGERARVSGSLRNFPMQANGAEMLRLACCLATERGITVCAPVHDAVLIEAVGDDIWKAVATTQAAMAEASTVVLDGFSLRTDAKVIEYPSRFQDEKGSEMWAMVSALLETEFHQREAELPVSEYDTPVYPNTPAPSSFSNEGGLHERQPS